MKKEPLGDLQGLIKNVKVLPSFIHDAYMLSENERYGTLETDFRLFHHLIKGLYEYWFPKAKKCTDQDIVNNIFYRTLQEKDLKIWVKYSISCLLNSCERVFNNIKEAKESKNIDAFQGELNLLYDMAFEAPILLEAAVKIMEKKKIRFGHSKRSYTTAREVYNVSQQILTKVTNPQTFGGFALTPSAIMLLRQSIELWLWEIWGIQAVTDENNKIIKLKPEKLFELLDNKGHLVKLPIPKSVLMKIHKWTQPYVHAGWMKFTWEIEHAQHILSPIFHIWEIDVKESYYNNIEEKLRIIMDNPKLKLHRIKEPPCNLIK